MHDPIEYPDEWGFIDAAPKIDKVSPKFMIFDKFYILVWTWRVRGGPTQSEQPGQCISFQTDSWTRSKHDSIWLCETIL